MGAAPRMGPPQLDLVAHVVPRQNVAVEEEHVSGGTLSANRVQRRAPIESASMPVIMSLELESRDDGEPQNRESSQELEQHPTAAQ